MADHFGLDIGSDTIKIIQLEKRKNSFVLVAAGIARNPLGNFNLDDEKGVVTLAEAIKKLKNEAKVTTNLVVAALPERNIFSQIVELPKMEGDQLSKAIPWEAENIIPQPISEVNLDWEIIEDEESLKNNKTKILLIAAPSVLVNKYLQVLKLADLATLSLETEGLAIVRCLKKQINEGDIALVNMGAKSLDIILVNRGNLFLSRQLPSAGEAITRAVSNTLGLDLATAEEYKKTYGLSPQLEGKVEAAIKPILSVIADEIKKALHFYEEKNKANPRMMVIFGGTALLPGIIEYFAKTLGLEVQIADPLTLVFNDQPNLQSFRAISPLLTVACGLAMKEK